MILRVFKLILTGIFILTIWQFEVFPTQDGPSHIMNAYILSHYDEFKNFFELNNLLLVPNLIYYGFMFLMTKIFHPFLADKIFLTIYILLMVFSFEFLISTINKNNDFLSLFIFPFIFNYNFAKGFYNFIFSVPILFLLIAFYLRNYNKLILLIMSILLYFSHPTSFLIFFIFVLIYNLLYIKEKKFKVIYDLIFLGPVVFLLVLFLNENKGEIIYFQKSFEFNIESIIIFNDSFEKIISSFLFFIISYLFLWTIYKLIKEKKIDKITINFLIILFICFYMAFFGPEGSFGGGHATSRFNLFTFIFTIIILSFGYYEKFSKNFLSAILILVSFASWYISFNKFLELKPYLEEFMFARFYLKPKTYHIRAIFSQFYDNYRFMPFRHLSCVFLITNESLNLFNYEATTKLFPIKFKNYYNPFNYMDYQAEFKPKYIKLENYPLNINYIIVWDMENRSKNFINKIQKLGYKIKYKSYNGYLIILEKNS